MNINVLYTLTDIFLILFEFTLLYHLKLYQNGTPFYKSSRIFILLYTYITSKIIFKQFPIKNDYLKLNISFIANILIFSFIQMMITNENKFTKGFFLFNLFLLIFVNIFNFIYKKLNINSIAYSTIYNIINNIVTYIYIDYIIDYKFDNGFADIGIYGFVKIIVNILGVYIRNKLINIHKN